MNVYDFDKTIFYPDSSYCFILYCIRRYPRVFISKLPDIIKSRTAAELKENLFYVLHYIPDIDDFVRKFWDKNFCRIAKWYLAQKKEDDLIISASPEFLVSEAASRLGVKYIATPMDKYTGNIRGVNCHDEEKVRRFYSIFPHGQINEFYSDSLSDSPLAEIAKKSFIVKKNNVKDWPC